MGAALRSLRVRVRPERRPLRGLLLGHARNVASPAPLRPSRGLFAALVATQVAYGKVPALREPAGTRGIVCLMLGASTAEAIEARGARGAAAVGSAGALGFAVELLGVATGTPFGHYHYSDRLGPRVGGVPLLAAAAWAMMARPSWIVAGHLSRRQAMRVPLAAGALTAWDVFLDPRMAREGFWTWPGGGRYEGIPASNFLGWFATGLGVFSLWALLDPDEDADARDDGALALYAWTWIGETFANAALWHRPVTAVAGSAAMGAFAAPALAARVRSGRGARTRRRGGRRSGRR